jgi:phenylacetate-CoA ligase
MIREIWELRRVFKNRKLSRDNLKALREARLRHVIRNACEHVPYYRSLFRSAELAPSDIRTEADLRRVPVTTKDDLRSAGYESIIAEWVDRSSLISVLTSGSTGKPFRVHRSPREWKIARALNMAALMTAGFGPRDRLAVLGPDWSIRPGMLQRLGLFRSEVIPLPVTGESQMDRLKELQPTMIWTYPSALRSLIHGIDYPLRDLIHPRVVITFAESIDPMLKEEVEAELDAELFSFYGASEFGRIAWECPQHQGLHVNADHFILECLDDGQPVEPGGTGTAVLTNLYAFAMPFIRYELGDICRLLNNTCHCGCTFPLMDTPEGRADDMVTLPSGKILPPHRFDQILRVFPGMFQWQVLQESDRRFIIKLVISGRTPENLFEQITERFLDYFGEPVSIDIQVVDHLDNNGPKARTFISKAPPRVDS